MEGGGSRRWEELDGLEGKRYMKTILTVTYLSLVFVFCAVHSLICASIVTPSFGKARPWVVVRLQPRNINIWFYDWSHHQLEENERFCSASELASDCPRHSTGGTTALVLTLWVPNETSWGAVGACRWRWKGKCPAMAMTCVISTEVIVSLLN